MKALERRTRKDIEATDVERLVDTFYKRVRADRLLSYVFDEVAQTDWAAHLPVMYRFWKTVLFAIPGYKGDPGVVHLEASERVKAVDFEGIVPEHFDRWIELFHQTVDELFEGPRATHAKRAVLRMQVHLKAMIAGRPPSGRRYRPTLPVVSASINPEQPKGAR